MQLHTFANDKGSTTISADKLDENFSRLKPIPQDGSARQYAVTETPNGWKLTLFFDQILQQNPEAANQFQPSLVGSINTDSTGAYISQAEPDAPGDERFVVTMLGTSPTDAVPDVISMVDFIAKFIAAMPENLQAELIAKLLLQIETSGRGDIALREVERCDGQRMLVLGTAWY